MRIDAHQHFWALERGDYGWLTPDLVGIYRDFQPDHLTPLLTSHKIGGTVLVQAAPTVAETDYMLSLAARNDFIKGVVGWVDFEDKDAAKEVARLAKNKALVGLRPMIQDIEDADWMLREDLGGAYQALIEHDLTFDALTLPIHLQNLARLVERHPDMRVVIDHGSKPYIRDRKIDGWAQDMASLARDTDAFCKLSGLVTEAASDWSARDLRPYVDHLLECFGPSRLIWGSDWPVCTLAAGYGEWFAATELLLAGLSDEERKAVFGGNAARAYKLDIPS